MLFHSDDEGAEGSIRPGRSKMEKRRLRDCAVLYGAFLVYSASTVCAKYAARQDMMVKVLVFAVLELVCLGVYALVWQQVLSRIPLVVAMANKGSVVLINLIWSVLLFGEQVNGYNLAGAAIIIAGIWLVSGDRNDQETEKRDSGQPPVRNEVRAEENLSGGRR
jgi:uncharacterized membrane protein